MIRFSKTTPDRYTGDMVVYLAQQNQKDVRHFNDIQGEHELNLALESGDFSGKEGQVFMCYTEVEKDGKSSVQRVLVVGLGEDEPTCETFRKGGGTAAAAALKTKSRKIMVVMPESIHFDKEEMAQSLTEGLLLGSYRFRKYKQHGNNNDEPGEIKEIALHARDGKDVRRGIELGLIISRATGTARDIANEPGSRWTPASFAEYGLKLADTYGFTAKVISKEQMKRMGMGGILAVNQGSAEQPKMLILEYRTGRKVPTMLLVGKGLTFDSGGLSLKPAAGMEEMKYDKCGGAAVLAVMQAVGEIMPKKIDVVAIVPATDNLPGPAAVKPGDIITIYEGKTVEVINTDAEGRLILADALAYGIKKFKPALAIDIATLTGAVIIGLGHHHTGLMATDDTIAEKIMQAGQKSGEPLWRLPLGKEYTKQLKSEVADIKNVGNRDGGSITAAAFLQEFIGDTPWAHLDIAGTAWNFTEKSYIPKGPSGTGTRTLIELIRSWG